MKCLRRLFPYLRGLALAFNALAIAFALYVLHGARDLSPWRDFGESVHPKVPHAGGYIYYFIFAGGAIRLLLCCVLITTILMLAAPYLTARATAGARSSP